MKKILILTTLSILIFSCGKKDDNTNIDTLVKSKNVDNIKAKRDLLQADLAKLDAALGSLDTKKPEEALVSVLTVKDTTFNHYLEVQGNVDTKQNILIQPEMPGKIGRASCRERVCSTV